MQDLIFSGPCFFERKIQVSTITERLQPVRQKATAAVEGDVLKSLQ